jgi:hypothetical protein
MNALSITVCALAAVLVLLIALLLYSDHDDAR